MPLEVSVQQLSNNVAQLGAVLQTLLNHLEQHVVVRDPQPAVGQNTGSIGLVSPSQKNPEADAVHEQPTVEEVVTPSTPSTVADETPEPVAEQADEPVAEAERHITIDMLREAAKIAAAKHTSAPVFAVFSKYAGHEVKKITEVLESKWPEMYDELKGMC